ncbi:MAG TPA: ATP-binding protein [Methylomirabilota bacterium]|nr:ATP-binding protein [Methylomirabilota bacterium]
MRFPTESFHQLKELLRPTTPDPAQQLFRLKTIERDIVLPIKALYLGILVYHFYLTPWYGETETAMQIAVTVTKQFLAIYIVANVTAGIFLVKSKRLSLVWGQRVVFAISVLDSLFLSAVTLVTTGGFDSVLYWVFMGLVIRNALTFPVARMQILLNAVVVCSFALAGILDVISTNYDIMNLEDPMLVTYGLPKQADQIPVQLFLLRFTVLIFLAGSCYGLQVLTENARTAIEEAREFAARQEQLRAAGRVAAEIAHQIKNPLSIINNAAFALQRSVIAKKPVPVQEVNIIREEIERADRIITELMGYAQLAEGRVERLNVIQELNRAINQVFPPGTYRAVQVRTDYADHLPPLLMQRKHFSEIAVNLLQNAREVLAEGGHIEVSAEAKDEVVYILIQDDGPGIPPEKTQRIFEPYFSTKPHGTGLGLSIVRHNAEIYGGHVRVESELGHGARFILELPTRTFMKIRQ